MEDRGMTRKISHSRMIVAALAAGALLSLPQFSLAAARNSGAIGLAAPDSPDGSSAAKSKLDKSQFKDVQVTVDANGVATLTGSVSLYEYKADATKRVSKAKGVTAVRDQIDNLDHFTHRTAGTNQQAA